MVFNFFISQRCKHFSRCCVSVCVCVRVFLPHCLARPGCGPAKNFLMMMMTLWDVWYNCLLRKRSARALKNQGHREGVHGKVF
jgi:hypothetical protein